VGCIENVHKAIVDFVCMFFGWIKTTNCFVLFCFFLDEKTKTFRHGEHANFSGGEKKSLFCVGLDLFANSSFFVVDAIGNE